MQSRFEHLVEFEPWRCNKGKSTRLVTKGKGSKSAGQMAIRATKTSLAATGVFHLQ
jgi:hypothetical protein